MRFLMFYIGFFLGVSVLAAIKGEWTVWVIALFAAFYFTTKFSKD